MKVALYKGISVMSRAIRFMTRSPYSHAAFLFDEAASAAAHGLWDKGELQRLNYVSVGSVVEAWEPGGTRNTAGLQVDHEPGTGVDIFRLWAALPRAGEEALLRFLNDELGTPYDFMSIIRFVTKRPGRTDRSWFCSELVFAALAAVDRRQLERTEPWEVPPDWLARCPGLVYEKAVIL